MDDLKKIVVIDGVRYESKRRSTDAETNISCERCAFYKKTIKGTHTLICQSAEHHDMIEFCADMLKKGWHTWFEVNGIESL